MNVFTKTFFFLAIFTLSFMTWAAEKEYSSAQFLEVVRHPPGRESWAAMNGTAFHLRRDKDVVEAPLYLGIRFTSERTMAQVVINGNEAYFVGQAYNASKESASVIPANKIGYPKSMLADFGLRPQDLTMTFLFWDFVRELPRMGVKGRECRVFLLESQDKKELAKVYISAEYFFPLKVEWFALDDKELKKPYRTLEISSFKKENDFWIVSSLILYGPGWQTKIEFSQTAAGFKSENMPKDLFKDIK